ncbi:MAG: Tol-Pal system beta propeller repeat protein TolB [Gammaproteobacteria bacterium]|nr:Tol-Pal system beta propeller repeat protein TolB [Gammaproteobacteria bacterium]
MKKLFGVVFVILVALPLYATAALDLELTQGVDKALPVALMPFAGDSAAANVTQVVNGDLGNSGQFNISLPKDLPSPQGYNNKINYSYWRGQKINNVIVGSVSAGGYGYEIRFKLIDIYNHKVLLKEGFNCSKFQLRELAHHVSDLIYQQLTGVRGIFSTKIAYVLVQRNGDKQKFSLMVADQDGFHPRALLISPEPLMSPAWSPDGGKIAYVSFENKRATIYVQNVATGQRRVVTKYPGINGAPAWSPDGRKMALVLTKTGYPKIYTLNLRSNKLEQITTGYALDTEPAWAPDGKSIIFTSSREGGPQIYRVYLNNKKVERVTYQGNYNARASFTADGKSIVMLHREDGMFNIAAQDLASGRINFLTAAGMDESPSIAPNGSMVVYATNYGGRGILAEVSLDGRVKLRLPAQEGEVQEPAWGPFI